MVISENVKSTLITIKDSVRNERVAINLSQKEFSEFINIKYSTYRNFEHQSGVYNQIVDKQINTHSILSPIVDASQKQIIIDKNIFGNELFYSVDNGHVYEVSRFISIMLTDFNDKRLMLLLKYFGEKRLKPYILREKNIKLLKKFNKHISFINEEI